MMNNLIRSKPLPTEEVKRACAQKAFRQRNVNHWLGQIGQALQLQHASNYK